MSYTTYDLTKEEIQTIFEVNTIGVPEKKCRCAIHDKKPSHCQQGPLLTTLMPECGYKFEVVKGEMVRTGACKMCGRCCALPRKNGSPYGFFDPLGNVCMHLIIGEEI